MLDKIITKQREWAVDEWVVRRDDDDVSDDVQTVFSQGNGFFGIRGIDEEQAPSSVAQSGAFVQGLYEIQQDHELLCMKGAPVLPDVFYRAAPSPHFLFLQVKIGDAVFSPDQCSLYSRRLDLRTGVLRRDAVWELPDGKKLQLCFKRLVSLKTRQLFASQLTLIPLNFSGQVELVFTLDAETHSVHFGNSLWANVCTAADEDRVHLSAETKHSKLSVNLICKHRADGGVFSPFSEQLRAGQICTMDLRENETAVLEKTVWLDTSTVNCSEIEPQLNRYYDEIETESVLAWAEFWADSDVRIDGNSGIQQGVRFSIAQLRQAYREGPAYGLGAKGLTSEGYGLAHFWDSEIYMLPFYLHTMPELAKQILMFRYNNIDKARDRARRLHQKGAMFAFMSVQGEDNPAAWACILGEQFINATLPYAIWNYVTTADDEAWLVSYGAEMVIECARFWAGRVSFNKQSGKYFINQITGPDEYAEWVNNDFFANVMAAWTLRYGAEVIRRLKASYTAEWQALAGRLDYGDGEESRWCEIAGSIHTIYNDELGINEQHNGFCGLDDIDLEALPASEFPLESHWPWPKVLQHKVLKQPDVLLAELLLSDEFSAEQKKADYEYYEPLTTHDSSLSPCIHSILAVELGVTDKAFQYLENSARLDLDYGDSAQGIHLANAAGAWMSIVYGLAGYRQTKVGVSFAPAISKDWKSYSFRLKIRGSLVGICVTPDAAQFELLSGGAVEIQVNDENVQLENSMTTAVRILQCG